jgi:ADP-ribose pyrophosphatase
VIKKTILRSCVTAILILASKDQGMGSDTLPASPPPESKLWTQDTLPPLALNDFTLQAKENTDIKEQATDISLEIQELISGIENLERIREIVQNAIVQPTHENFGIGARCAYPESALRDAIKNHTPTMGLNPVPYTADVVQSSVWEPGKDPSKAWADPMDTYNIPAQLNQGRKRVIPFGESATDTKYGIIDNIPQNPMGETGISQRGELGLWGPNPAADPIVFQVIDNQLHVLLIKRNDKENVIETEWAIPGGMLDAEDNKLSANAALRELKEETGINLSKQDNCYFIGKVYAGPVDDKRNTNNAWMESNVYAWIIKTGVETKFKIDTAEVQNAAWVTVTPDLLEHGHFFASHGLFIKAAVRKLLPSH